MRGGEATVAACDDRLPPWSRATLNSAVLKLREGQRSRAPRA
ncbi:hypothetical protein C4K39_0190 [Pseudomonas sessilinigenes]|nr:hypothetical protein C4K39_0190 [Pseudomonas sessilinigenes]